MSTNPKKLPATCCPPPARRAFTLVEMLVVITIIGILAALGTVAVFQALAAAKKARIKAEITNLESAMQQYKTQYKDFPPSYFGPWRLDDGVTIVEVTDDRHPVRRHLASAFPRIQEPTGASGTWEKLRNKKLSGANALVFWLQGFSKNVTLPLSGPGGPLSTSGEIAPLFDFDKTRLTNDSNGNPVYLPQGSTVPYQYLAAQSYLAHAMYDPSNPAPACPYLLEPWDTKGPTGLSVGSNASMSDVVLDASNNAVPGTFQSFAKLCANPKSFQLIAAGLDNDFGSYNSSTSSVGSAQAKNGSGTNCQIWYKSYSSGAGYDRGGADDDNLTNFSEKSLGDARPQ